MAYEKQTWQTGDVITQEKLNHMEDGIEDAYELPAVTETDNGKVLGVENGQFGLVDGGGSDGVRTCIALQTVQTGSSAGEGEPVDIAVTHLIPNNDITPSEYLSFQDLYELSQDHDLIISAYGGSFVILRYQKANPSWGIAANFSANGSFWVSSSNGEAQWYDIKITENSMTSTLTAKRYFQLSNNIPSD